MRPSTAYGESWEAVEDSWVTPGTAANIQRLIAPSVVPSATAVSLAMFNQIQLGMELPEVVRIVGHPGTEISRTQMEDATTLVYGWTNPDLSSLSVTLKNDRVASKFQFRLK